MITSLLTTQKVRNNKKHQAVYRHTQKFVIFTNIFLVKYPTCWLQFFLNRSKTEVLKNWVALRKLPICNEPIHVRLFFLKVVQIAVGLQSNYFILVVISQWVQHSGALLIVIAFAGNTPFTEEMPQRWRAVGNTLYDLIVQRFESQSSLSRSETQNT